MGVAIAVSVAAATFTALRSHMGDYAPLDTSNADNPAPAINAVLTGHLGSVPSIQPVMGLTSLVVRLPFAAAGRALDGRLLEYRLGALACLLLFALAGLLVVRRALMRRDTVAAFGVLLVFVANPVVSDALYWGHPEELLAAALSVVAVLAASGRRPVAAGALLGLAVGTKPWALLAAAPVLLAARVGVWRLAAAAMTTGALVLVPLPALNVDAYRAAVERLGKTTRVWAHDAWWPISRQEPRLLNVGGRRAERGTLAQLPTGLTRGGAAAIAFLLALVLALALRRGAPLPAGAALAFLACLLVLRCVFDPLNQFYYGAPFLAAIAAWEGLTRRGLPVVALLSSVLLWVSFRHGPSSDAQASLLFLAWIVPLGLILGRTVVVASRRRPATVALADRP